MTGLGFVLLSLSLCLQLTSAANSCSKDFGKYVNCLEKKGKSKADKLENEFYKDLKKETKKCFETQFTGKNRFCPFPAAFMTSNSFDSYESCASCHEMSKHLQRKLVFGPPNKNKCALKTLLDAFEHEMSLCVRPSLGKNFEPRLPNLEGAKQVGTKFKVLQSMTLLMSSEIMQDVCVHEKRNLLTKTQKCLDPANDKKIGKNHCNIVTQCIPKKKTACGNSDFKDILAKICQCAESHRLQLTMRLKSILSIIENLPARTKDHCIVGVTTLLWPNEGADWQKHLNEMFKCISKPPITTMEDFIEQGCKDLINSDNSETLVSGFHFLANFLNALLSRALRFCPCAL